MNTINQISCKVGLKAYYYLNGFNFEVFILNAKQAYGNTRYLITPVNGSGKKYVDSSKLTFCN